jgi:hypothetical protein
VRLEGLGKLKKSSDLIENRTCGLPACSIVPQPTGLMPAQLTCHIHFSTLSTLYNLWSYINSFIYALFDDSVAQSLRDQIVSRAACGSFKPVLLTEKVLVGPFMQIN